MIFSLSKEKLAPVYWGEPTNSRSVAYLGQSQSPKFISPNLFLLLPVDLMAAQRKLFTSFFIFCVICFRSEIFYPNLPLNLSRLLSSDNFPTISLVGARGVEPPRHCWHMILNHACLPVPARAQLYSPVFMMI